MRPQKIIILFILSLAITLSGCAHQPKTQVTAIYPSQSELKQCHHVNEVDRDVYQCNNKDVQRQGAHRQNVNGQVSLVSVFTYSIIQLVIEGMLHALLNH